MLAGCGNGVPVLHCNNDSQCFLNGVHGMCVEPDGVCAIPSASCPSGWIFDKSAGAVAGQCVPPNNDLGTPDMGMEDGGSLDMASSDMAGGGTKMLGTSCSSDGDCASGFCTDGVCCNGRCDGQCQQCVVGTGYCVTVTSGQPVGSRPACTGAGTLCGGTCTVASASSCTYPTTSCRSPSCAGGSATLAANCDGAGHCPSVTTQTCSPYICGPTTCKNNCQSISDCVPGDQCNGDGTCTPVNPQLIAPLSTASVTSRRPTLRWILPVGATSPVVDICPTRACATTIATVTVDGTGMSGTPTTDLPTGIVFWRVRATVGSGTGVSQVWEFSVGNRTATTANTSWGTILDVNGDGYADLAVSALGAASGNGKVYVFHGSATGLSTTASSVITGAGNQFGKAVASAGDINGDGYADLIVGAPLGNGAAYVYLGGPSGLGATPSAASTLLPTASSTNFGSAVASAGDVNGDGYADVVVGAPFPASQGAVFVYLGGANGLGATPPLPSAITISPGGGFGTAVASADANGDGYSDVIVGAPAATYNGITPGPGKVYVYRGSSSGLVVASPTVIPAPTGFAFGGAVAGGDVNGDGYADIAVGQITVGAMTSGAAYVFLGGSSISTTPASVWGTIPSPSSAQYYGFGTSVALADVDGDGFEDLAVGADTTDHTGAVYVYAATGGALSATPTTPADPTGVNGHFGTYALARGGDFNVDGKQDLVVGATCPMFSAGSCGGAGFAYIFIGSASGITNGQMPVATWGTLTSSDGANAYFGTAVY